MQIQCLECKSNYKISEQKVPDAGAKIKCPKCQNVITVNKPKPEPPVMSASYLDEDTSSENRERPDTKKCPFCAEEILSAANKCKHCGSDFAENKSAVLDGHGSINSKPKKWKDLNWKAWVPAIVLMAVLAILGLHLMVVGEFEKRLRPKYFLKTGYLAEKNTINFWTNDVTLYRTATGSLEEAEARMLQIEMQEHARRNFDIYTMIRPFYCKIIKLDEKKMIQEAVDPRNLKK